MNGGSFSFVNGNASPQISQLENCTVFDYYAQATGTARQPCYRKIGIAANNSWGIDLVGAASDATSANKSAWYSSSVGQMNLVCASGIGILSNI